MISRPKLILELCAVLVSLTGSASLAHAQTPTQTQASGFTSITPVAASAPTAVPALVPFSGVAVGRDGHALSVEIGITFLIYKDQTGGEPLFVETQRVVPDSTGHYLVRLGASMSSGIPLELFSSGEARWLDVQIVGEPAQPRILLASVPYAIKAGDATTLGGLPASAFVLAGSKTTATAAGVTSAAVTPFVSSGVTTPGGTSGTLPFFTGTSTIANSIVVQNSSATGIGVGIVPASTTALDVNGKAVVRGVFNLSRTGNATATTAFNSYPFVFNTSAWNSSSAAQVAPVFALQAEPISNNTTNPGATFNLVYNHNGGPLAETGLSFNSNGTINFAAGQTFPGGGGSGAGSAVCIATGGGFGSGGTTFVAPSFAVPAGGGCTSWSGFTKTATTVVLTTSGSACLSTDAKQLTVSVSSADPNFLGAGTMASDYIQLNRTSTTGSFTSGSDQGEFSGTAVQVSCSASLLQLNENND